VDSPPADLWVGRLLSQVPQRCSSQDSPSLRSAPNRPAITNVRSAPTVTLTQRSGCCRRRTDGLVDCDNGPGPDPRAHDGAARHDDDLSKGALQVVADHVLSEVLGQG
jgi:hypothetical protein